MKIIYIIILTLSIFLKLDQKDSKIKDLAGDIIEKGIDEGNLTKLLEARHEGIPLDKWIKENRIKFDQGQKDIQEIVDGTDYATLVNMDQDDDMELYLLLLEGSMGNPRILIYDKNQGQYRLRYEYGDYKDGRKIYPLKIEGQVFYVSIDTDFETKFVHAITVYDFEEWRFTNYKRYILEYNYEPQAIMMPLCDYMDEEFFSTLTKFESIPTGMIKVKDSLNNRSFIVDIQVSYTSVWYEPNKIVISSPEPREPKIKGFSKLLTTQDGEDCLNLKFYIDGDESLHLAKICYPKGTDKSHLGKLVIRDYVFGNEVKEVMSQVIYPRIKVKDIKSGILE